MRKLLDPRRLLRLSRGACAIVRGGGPDRIRLLRVEGPDGYILPSGTAVLEVETREGETVGFEPSFVVPPLYAWGWRIGRWAGVPVISSFDPEDLHASFRVPRRE